MLEVGVILLPAGGHFDEVFPVGFPAITAGRAVGALVVSPTGEVVGRGTHTYDGVKHAEVLALEQAGEKASGGTLYLTLEPCSHQGRTGPCVEAVIAAGIKRVVAATHDHPHTRGENDITAHEIQSDRGPSPHAWGELVSQALF